MILGRIIEQSNTTCCLSVYLDPLGQKEIIDLLNNVYDIKETFHNIFIKTSKCNRKGKKTFIDF